MPPSSFEPPRWATKFFRWFCKAEYHEDIQGDLEEEFQLLAKTQTLNKAKNWYAIQILRLFRPSMMKEMEPADAIQKESAMYKNYLKIGFRNLWKYRSSTLINVIGLSTGLAAFVLIALYIKDELSYDRHHEHAEEIYRVTVKNYTRSGDMSRQWAFASSGHARRLKQDYSSITKSTRFYCWVFPNLQYDNKTFPSEQVVFADNDVFDIFTFPFIVGNPEDAMTDLYSLVLTESTAIKIFGNDWKEQDILGEQVVLSRDGQEAPFKVTGVMQDMPEQQHFQFDYLAPIRFIEQLFGEERVNNVGGNYNWLTYVRIPEGTNIDELEAQMNDEFWDKYLGVSDNGEFQPRDFYDFELQPLLDIHLQSNLEGEYTTNGSLQQIQVFSIVGLLVLLVACVNYMNIATSHYSRRMKEVGVRKAIGALKTSLVKQFLTESTLVTVISFPFSVILILWALPYLNNFVEKELTLSIVENTWIIGGLLGLLLLVGVAAGIYPALFLSKINIINALKGEQAIRTKKVNFRSVLVTFQYGVTVALIFAIIVIEKQLYFIRNSDAGYQREQIISLDLPRGVETEVLKSELLTSSNVQQVTFSSRIPTGRLMDNWGSRYYVGDSLVRTDFRLPIVSVDPDFLSTYEIELVAGENFREDMKTELVEDSMAVGHYIVNEAAATAMGYEDPTEALQMKMRYGPSEGRVIGIMKDFHFESVHSTIVPMIIVYRDNARVASIKINENNIKETLEHIETTYARFDPLGTAYYDFVDDLFEEQYEQEHRLSTMIKVFATLAILIGCLGLIGMVGFIIETRIKEIGIRKVLGASTSSIWMLITNQFVIFIGIACLAAIPLTYWLMNDWLQNFAYRTSVSLILFIAPLFATLTITLAMISNQTFRATRVNPVEFLKDE